MKRTFILITLFVFCSITLFAQNNADTLSAAEREKLAQDLAKLKKKPLQGFVTISFMNSIPQDEFMDNLGRSGPGFMLNGGWQPSKLPLALGLEGDFLFYGGNERKFYYYRPGGWEAAVDTISYNNFMIPLTLFARIQPNFEDILYPYVEAFAGVNIMIATSHLSPAFGAEDSQSETTSSFNYGIGAGTMIKIAEIVHLPDTRTQILLDIRFRYMFGASVDYYKITQINNDTSPQFMKFNSKTDMVTFSAGIAFRL